MTSNLGPDDAAALIREAFQKKGIAIESVEARVYPEETIFAIRVAPSDVDAAAALGNKIDIQLADRGFDGFVTVRRSQGEAAPPLTSVHGVHDDAARELARLLAVRSRASEQQPSLEYVPDSATSLARAMSARHHLIFGRRGAGKTALLVEVKRQVEESGASTIWVNLQPQRWQPAARTYLTIAVRLLDSIEIEYRSMPRPPHVATLATELNERITRLLARSDTARDEALAVVPLLHGVIQRFLATSAQQLFVFLDDFYFVRRDDQVELLELLHSSVRDTDVWLKVATIKHLTKWFEPANQTGLQTGDDADVIDLDLTLQDPSLAKVFLERVLGSYATRVGIDRLTRIYSPGSLDRLVLASGSVPRDYLTLASDSLVRAQARTKARQVGVQDVNRAAGEAAQIKLRELEEDLSSDSEWANTLRSVFDQVVSFALDETKWTFMRIDFRDREEHKEAHAEFVRLMDLRMIHLLNASVSDHHRAGEKSEVYLLDLSQYSGDRLKKYLHVLDFHSGHFVLKETGKSGTDRVADTPRKLVTILRLAPAFELSRLASTPTPP